MGFLNLQIFMGSPQNKYEAGGLGRVQVEATPPGAYPRRASSAPLTSGKERKPRHLVMYAGAWIRPSRLAAIMSDRAHSASRPA